MTNRASFLRSATLIAVFGTFACSLPGPSAASPIVVENSPQPGDSAAEPAVAGEGSSPTPLPTVVHVATPGEPGAPKTVFDVESQSTAAERRAPYGDSYDINRFERPFSQEMEYVADLDINLYKVSADNDWWYVEIELMGTNPNNEIGVNYGVELDLDHDGFGDFLVLARPKYSSEWDTRPVQVFEDTNHNTGGLSAEKSDAPLDADGYETAIFNGGFGDADPDLAWVRLTSDGVEFAFKKSWAGSIFMLGVLADAGLKDPAMLDYVDRIEEAQAGSPVRDKKYYPLGDLYLVDNVCREAFGFNPDGYEPQLCPHEPPPQPRKTPSGCEPQTCFEWYYWDGASCSCQPVNIVK